MSKHAKRKFEHINNGKVRTAEELYGPCEENVLEKFIKRLLERGMWREVV